VIIKKKHFLFFLPGLIFLCGLLSCSSSNGIDDYFTFNLRKEPVLSINPFIQVGVIENSSYPLLIDSADMAKNGTSFSLVKSAKLTKLSLRPWDTLYSMSEIDTIILSVSADSLPDMLVAIFSGASDSISLTNADIAPYIKKPSSCLFLARYQINKDPKDLEGIILDYTVVLTAQPLQ
jgi:hypothetical protein